MSELVQRAQAGDLNAFETLVSRYERRIWALAKQLLQHDQDAEDVVQDTFLTALEHLHTLRDGERFGAWLKQIATRLAYRVLARRKRMPTESLDALLSEDPDEEETTPPRPQLVADWRDSPEALLQRRGDDAPY
jgi:RNA polymerase sigma-70 factor (ECF subfamily)